MGYRIKKRFFECALEDEVALASEARHILKDFTATPLSARQVAQLAKIHSPDIAARTFFESLLASEHGEFVVRLNSYAPDKAEHQANIKIFILPGMFYREHPEMGGDGTLIREIGRHFGFEVTLIKTDSTGSVSKNSDIIAETLALNTDHDTWLVAISKGSSDLRHYLQNHRVNNNIKGCVNVAGIPRGVPYIDIRLSKPFSMLFTRLLCALFKVDYKALLELQAEHEFWKNEHWIENMETIHLLPVPHSAHIHGVLRKKYHLTLHKGPNDGFVPLTDVLDWPGRIYPLWGCDHFLRTDRVSGYLYRLFNYIADQSNQKGTAQ